MAYMAADGRGPIGNKAGEWVSNHHEPDPHLGPDGSTRYQELAARMYLGPPRATPKYSVETLKGWGMSGLYWREDQPLPAGAVECPTPPELLEPAEACDDEAPTPGDTT